MKKTIIALIASTFLSSLTFAATHEIKMLNNGKDGIMAFEPAYLKAAKGDTIKFIPTDAAHDVASVKIPKGAKPFASAVGKGITTKVTEEGVYFYECKSHIPMAMVGVIQVGKPTNLAEVQTSAKELSKSFVMQKDRLDKILAQVK